MDSDDDFFSDDGWDSLPPSTLLQLEQNAYQATQVQKAQQTQDERVTPLRSQSTNTAQSHTSTSRQLIYPGPSLKPPPLPTGLTNEYGDLNAEEELGVVFDNAQGPMEALQQERAYAQQLEADQDIRMRELQHHNGATRQAATDGMEIEEEYIVDDTGGNGMVYEQHGISAQMEELMARIDEVR